MMHTIKHIALTLLLMLTMFVTSAPSPHQLGCYKHHFIDDSLIAKTQNLSLVLIPPVPMADALASPPSTPEKSVGKSDDKQAREVNAAFRLLCHMQAESERTGTVSKEMLSLISLVS